MSKSVNPKDLAGSKKAPLRYVPPALVICSAPVYELGAMKYGPFNWREIPIQLQSYLEAIERHLFSIRDGEWLDPESQRPHMAHISATSGIVLDAFACGTLIDDLFTKGQAPELMRQLIKA